MKNKSRILKHTLLPASLVITGLFIACGGGNTDGSPSLGSGLVSDGGSGSKMSIELESGGNEIPTGDRVGFKVTAIDPAGAPLSEIRIFCESEHGIAILEPSAGGVAFEHTSTNGVMSGVLGGLTVGSYTVECRAPEGFNLIARKHFKVVGDPPAGFTGWVGAAGGNLGGGNIQNPGTGTVTITEVTFNTLVNGASEESRTADIDFVQDTDCSRDGNTTTTDVERFGVDDFNAYFVNGSNQRIFVQSVEIELFTGSNLVDRSVSQLGGLVVAAGSKATLVNAFTDFAGSAKSLVGSNVALTAGSYNVVFTFTYTTDSGETEEVEQSAAIRVDNFYNCP